MSTNVTSPVPLSPERAHLRERMTRPQRHRLLHGYPLAAAMPGRRPGTDLEVRPDPARGLLVGVLPHPFFATSARDGSFTIRGLPAGTYTIEAWHEKLGTKTMSVTVGEGETKTAVFTFGPQA